MMVGIVLGEISLLTIGLAAMIEIILVVALWHVYTEWSDLKKNYPELAVHQAAKKGSHPPIIEIMDLSGASRQFSGVKEKAQDVSFKNKDYRVIFDPRLAGTIPKDRYSDNVPVYRYVSSLYFPVDTIGAVAVSQCMDRIHKEYPELDFIHDDFTIMGLLAAPSEDLVYDIPNVLNSYPIENSADENGRIITADRVTEILQEIQLKMKTWGIKSGFYSIADAIKAIPIGTTAPDMQQVIQYAKLEYANDNKKGDYDKYFPVIAVCMIIGTIAMAYMVVGK